MEDNNQNYKKFRSVSLRDPLLKQVEEFIEKNPEFVAENPDYNSVAGFIDQATRDLLRKLKKAV